MSRNGLNIHKRKDGRFEGRYIKSYDNNKIKYGYIYGKNYSEVKAKLLNISNIDEVDTHIQFIDIADEWLNSLKIKVKESTYVKYYSTIEKHIKNSILDIPLYDLTSQMIISYTNNLMDIALANTTIKDILCVVSMIIKYYRKCYDENFTVNIVYPKVPKRKINILSDEEVKIFESYLINEFDYRKLGILVTLYTGVRIGEICGLKWEKINLSDGYIVIGDAMQRIKNLDENRDSKTKIIIGKPKSDTSDRIIPLQDYIVKLLLEYESSNKSAYFLTCSKSYIEPRRYENYYKKCLRECNIRMVTFHTLRHTFATRCIKSGMDIKSLSEILGHANINITLNRYVHPSFEDKKLSMNKLPSFVLT